MKRENDKTAPSKALYNWYPGHMAKALREVKKRLTLVDIVLEIRDARVPLASGNRALDAEVGNKCKLIVLNKSNLADEALLGQWNEWFEAQGTPFIFVNCFDKPALKKIVSIGRKIVEKNRRDCNPDYVATKTKLKMMIVGLPNTGKSTIINQLANRGATKVADKPGLTQIQQWITIENDVELLDTPGIMPPIPPTKPMIPDSIRKIEIIVEFFAPTAFRMPISLVLSLTEVYIVFIMPIPPTATAILPKAKTTTCIIPIILPTMPDMASLVKTEYALSPC